MTELPLVVIDTESFIRDEPKVRGYMKVIDNGEGQLNTTTDAGTDYAGYIGIELRGQSSQIYPKNNFDLETRKENGDNSNVSILGLPKENDWILHGPYSDKTLMRNVIAFDTARRLGHYASRTVFCEVIINGSYEGVYLFMEQLKLDKDRVDLEDDDIGGAYLMELTGQSKLDEDDTYFELPISQRPVVYYDPDPEELGPEKTTWIADHLNDFDTLLMGENFADPEEGYASMLDVAVAIDVILIYELFKNQDAFFYSTFLQKGSDSLIKLGPIWDFNISMGNSNSGASANLGGWILIGRSWPDRLYQDPTFVQAMINRWTQLREEGLIENLLSRIDGYALYLDEAQARNFERWPILGEYVWPNPVDPETGEIRQTYDEEVTYLKEWILARAQWMDANMAGLLTYGGN